MITQIFVNWLWSLKSTLKKYSTNIVYSHNTNRITYSMIQILQICIKTFTGNCPNTSKDGRYVTPYLITYSHSIIPKITSPDDDRIKIGTTIDDRKENDEISRRSYQRRDEKTWSMRRTRLVELNFTRIFTWPQYFIGHLMPGHVLLSLSGEGGHLWIKAPRLKISFSYRG